MKNIIVLIVMALVLAGCSAGAHLDFYGQNDAPTTHAVV